MDGGSNERVLRVAIIGGGAAGLAAAKALEKGNLEVTLFEARDRIGGRCHRVNVGGSGVFVDTGATWVHGFSLEHNSAARLVQKYRIETVAHSKLKDERLFFHEGKRISKKDCQLGCKLFKARDFDSPRKAEVESAFRARKLEFENYEGGLTEVMEEKNPFGLKLHGPHVCIRGGYPELLNRIASGLSKTKIVKNRCVESIDTSQSGLVIVDGEIFDRVIIALPLGVMQNSHAKLFVQPLSSEKLVAMEHFGSGIAEKLILHFDKVFWTREFFGCDRYVVTSLDEYANAPVLVVWTTTCETPEKRLDPNLVAEEILNWFHAKGTLVGHYQTDWCKDPLTMGAYSYPKRGATTQMMNDLACSEFDSRVFFAGEYLSSEYYGMVHGALDTGARAARQVMEEK